MRSIGNLATDFFVLHLTNFLIMKLHPDLFELLKSYHNRELTARETLDLFGELTDDDLVKVEVLRKKYERKSSANCFPTSTGDKDMKGADFMRFFQVLHDALFLGLRSREKIAAIDENVKILFPEWRRLHRSIDLFAKIQQDRMIEDSVKRTRGLLDQYFQDQNGSLDESFSSWHCEYQEKQEGN